MYSLKITLREQFNLNSFHSGEHSVIHLAFCFSSFGVAKMKL